MTINVTVANGKVNPSGATIKAKAGQTVLVTAVSDAADEVHIHGYDKELPLHPGQARLGQVHRGHEGHLRDRDARERQAGRQARRLVIASPSATSRDRRAAGSAGTVRPGGRRRRGRDRLSFVILGLAWRNPKYRGNASGKPLPAAITRTVDAGWFRWIVRLVGLAIFLYAMVSLLFGVDRLTNPIFGFIYILVWVGLVPISIVFGPVWRTLNPLRTIHLLLSKAAPSAAVEGSARAPGVGSVCGRPRWASSRSPGWSWSHRTGPPSPSCRRGSRCTS